LEATNYLGVVNGDMLAYDSVAQKRYEINAGTMISSQDVGHCVQDTDAAYSLGLTDDFIITGASTGSDHASFWNVNVGAVFLIESDFTPYYHTVNDTVANLYPNFATDLTKAALGSLAAMAIPIQACFTSAPVLTAVAGELQVNLSWTSVTGASSYRVFRSTQGCQGQWFEQTSTTGLSWTDTNVVGGATYYYYVEAVASDGFCVSNMSNCQTITVPLCTNCAAYHSASNILVGNPIGGDNDANPDNCETVTARVTVDNIGAAIAQNVQINITSTNNFISITTPMPIVISSIPVGNSANTQFIYTVGTGSNKATCMQTGTFSISVLAQGQSSPDIKSFTFTHEVDSATGNKTYAFEPATGLEGWTVSSGTWALSSTRVNTGGSTRSVHSSQSQANVCDVMTSPTIMPAPGFSSTLTIPNWYATEQSSPWYDRANVHIIDVDAGNTRTLVSPASGKLYKTGTYSSGSCSIGTEAGWAGNATADRTWGNSVFNLGTTYAGKNIKIEVRYYTDGSVQWEGVYVDDISITNIITTACDAYSDTCVVTNPPGRVTNTLYVAKTGTNLNMTWTVPVSPCVTASYGIYRGNLPWSGYNHASMSCTVTTNSYTAASGTGSYYFLVVAQNNSKEGSYGKDSAGAERPAASSPCLTQEISTCN